MSKRSFTLLELLVSAIILVMTLAGLLATFVAARRAVIRSSRRVATFNIARKTLESLYEAVDASTWDSGALQVGSDVGNGSIALPPEYINYTWSYDVIDLSSSNHAYRQVNLIITYPDT